MDEADYDKMIAEGRACDEEAARARAVDYENKARDVARQDAEWKFEHELMVDNYRVQAFYGSAYTLHRWGGFGAARDDLAALRKSQHAAVFQENELPQI